MNAHADQPPDPLGGALRVEPDREVEFPKQAIVQYLEGKPPEKQMLIPTQLYYRADAEWDGPLIEKSESGSQ